MLLSRREWARALDALRLLRAHRAPVAVLPAEALEAADVPLQDVSTAASDGSHAIRLRLGDASVPVLVRPRQAHVTSWDVDEAVRAARLAPSGPRIAAVGPVSRALAHTWPWLVDRDDLPRWVADWGRRGWRRPEVALLDADHPDPRRATAAERSAVASGVTVVRVSGDDLPVLLDPERDRPRPPGPKAAPERLTVHAGTEPPDAAVAWCGLRVLAAGAPPRAVATTVVRAAARGVATSVEGPEAWRAHVDPTLLAELNAADRADLTDPGVRERTGVRLHRVAWRSHHPRAALVRRGRAAGLEFGDEPTASILLVTARADFLEHALAQVRAQTYRPLQLVLAAHGDAPVPAIARVDRASLGDIDLVTRQIPENAPLGAVLNAAAESADGTVITKMDDDDWYGPDHVADCVEALRRSGAPLAGKGAEFIYLAAHNLTIRRAISSERFSDTISGATLTLHREDLLDLGGFAPQRRAVDRRLIDAVERTGERPYRTHGLQFVVNRHGGHTTWTAGTDYFLARAHRQWPGLARVEADLETP